MPHQTTPPDGEHTQIIIVGAGYAGLACAIECKRKGHQVLVLEKVQKFKVLGDVISLGSNAGRIIARWGLHDKLWDICGHAPALKLHDYRGELIQVQPLPQPLFGAYAYNGHRAQIHEVLFQYALSIGVEIRMDQDVGGYWESAETNKAGVFVQGEKLEADVVVAADGIKSQARQFILGYRDNPRPSGYSIYRAWFDAVEHGIDTDTLTDFLCKDGDVLYGWIGQDVHFLTSSQRQGKSISWVITHKDNTDIQDGWSFPGKIEDVLRIVEGWDPRCAAIISKAPSCIDWKLIVHDPLPTWLSKGARVVLIGDAAHPFLPTSVQGASQAVEDGVTLAVTLKLAGKGDVPLATRTWEAIRYQRVRKSQLLGESTRDKWHRAKPGDNGEDLDLPMPEWLHAFDAEEHAYSVYDGIAKSILEKGYLLPTIP
ncbi:monooxygenase [Leucogyrophana mollusca]|uniref:Monooxygenase n=1 Tax=Leucogyrophana mollusca TaxID=85980 RepID=A0ACB8BWR4_9AGAM|nr:monooxygenase [Leucogyrophana mollusca]